MLFLSSLILKKVSRRFFLIITHRSFTQSRDVNVGRRSCFLFLWLYGRWWRRKGRRRCWRGKLAVLSNRSECTGSQANKVDDETPHWSPSENHFNPEKMYDRSLSRILDTKRCARQNEYHDDEVSPSYTWRIWIDEREESQTWSIAIELGLCVNDQEGSPQQTLFL